MCVNWCFLFLQTPPGNNNNNNKKTFCSFLNNNNNNDDNNDRWKQLGEIECLALVIACLCHDLDHRGESKQYFLHNIYDCFNVDFVISGTNNSFQVKSSNSLFQVYSTSTMEHHHFDQCIMLLNTNGTQLLANVSKVNYQDDISSKILRTTFKKPYISAQSFDFFSCTRMSLNLWYCW